MKTKFNALVPMLICDDTQVSIQFYQDLGFEVIDRMDDIGSSGWASLKKDAVQIMLASPTYFPTPVKVDGHYPQLVLYFYPDDIENLHQELSGKGYRVSELVARSYGMKEFEMHDPSGHMLVFGQSTDQAPPSL